ncbi:tetratricopeptide repeat protein [Ramlibacter sp. WS9]|uniref:tetratricopeptide repeat protein n=1 Tax=Ramlibacter sp. WS9 TaxID=1882741 RepID=UPI00114190D9|nr:tetratricopeptide repeat protein [Ramlibacter sp. WS9]ROZ63178.1 hypothetical protein EEB15_30005 [Ramlibacter sp. WS9]
MSNPTVQPPTLDLDRVERYLAADPANPHLLASAIDLSLAAGKLDAARKHADAAVALLPDDLFMAHRRGNVLIAQGELAQAAQVFAKLLQQTPDANIAFNLALVYFRQGDYTQALATLEPYIAADDVAPAAVTLFARTLHHLGEVSQAVAFVERHMPRCSGDTDFLAAASLLYLDNDQLDEAQRLSDAALAAGARPLEALVVSGSVALGRDDASKAKAMFGEAIAASPSDGRSWSGLGMASLLEGNSAEAKEQLQRAVTHMPTHIGSWHTLGWCHIMRGELSDAEQTFTQALALDRNFGESHGGLAVVHALQGRKSEAEEGIERALRLDKEGLSARYAQMVLSGVASDPEKFKTLALKILSARPGPAGATLVAALNKRKR